MKRWVTVVLALGATALAIYVWLGIRDRRELARLEEFRAELDRCPPGFSSRVDERTLPRSPPQTWSADGWQDLRWGMLAGDVAARVKRVPGTHFCRSSSGDSYGVFLDGEVAGQKVIGDFQIDTDGLRQVSFEAVTTRISEENSESDYRYSYRWNSQWRDVIRRGVQEKYRGKWVPERTDDRTQEQEAMVVSPSLRIWYYLQDFGRIRDGKTRWRMNLIYEDAAWYDQKRKAWAEEQKAKNARGL